MARPELPIDAEIPRMLEALRAGRNLVVRAPPGAGKTTRLPPALLDAGLLAPGERVIVLEPRRVAARAAARRIASERGAKVGEEIGYQVRFEDRTSVRTRLAVLTEGLLNRKLVADPLLEGVGAVVLDEFHERSIHADLALAFLREVQETVRPELRVIAMSATLETGPVASYLGDCPVIDVPGRQYPVDLVWLDAPDDRPLPVRAAAAVRRALDEVAAGDVLVFLPGAPEIRRTQSRLEESAPGRADYVPLYGDLSPEDQDRALEPGPRRKVILATNIAETSLTIEGVNTVVDCGLAKVMRHDPARGMDRLDLVRISRASATQRAGRAGRTAPGRAYRLWTRAEEQAMAASDTPEIARVDMAPVLLELLGFAARDPASFRWFEAPPAGALERASSLLRALGALPAAGWNLTAAGSHMRAFPLHPRLAACLLEAHAHGIADEGALAAALCAERDIARRGARLRAPHARESDVLVRMRLFEELESARFSPARADDLGLDAEAARAVARARDRLSDTARRVLGDTRLLSGGQLDVDAELCRALLAGFADRVARRRAAGGERVVLADGRGARIAPDSVVRGAALMVALDVEDTRPEVLGAGPRADAPAGTESLVRQASAIEEAWLGDGVVEEVRVRFDPAREAVEAVRERRYRGIVLATSPAEADAGCVAEVLAEAAARDPLRALAPEGDAASLIARAAFVRRACPDVALPDLAGAGLAGVLPLVCHGRRSFADLRRADLAGALRTLLGHARTAEIDRLAPERLPVPSGSMIRLRYEPDGPPVLPVKLQECFGLLDTPRVAGGRVAVKMELLGPNFRPVQITQDLASFWDRTYPAVRKDLRARYPKHGWPENPREAPPQRGTNRRSR